MENVWPCISVSQPKICQKYCTETSCTINEIMEACILSGSASELLFQLLSAGGSLQFTDGAVTQVLHFNCKASLISIKTSSYYFHCFLPLVKIFRVLQAAFGFAQSISPSEFTQVDWVNLGPSAPLAVQTHHGLCLDDRVNGMPGTLKKSK